MRPQRSVLIKVNPDGTIKERYRVLKEEGFDLPSGYIELEDQEDKALVAGDMSDVLYKKVKGNPRSKKMKIVKKPVVAIEVKRALIDADGEDETEIRLSGVPEDIEEVEVKVGRDKHKIDPKEPFYVNMTVPQSISVSLEDKTLKSSPVVIRGRKKVVKLDA